MHIEKARQPGVSPRTKVAAWICGERDEEEVSEESAQISDPE